MALSSTDICNAALQMIGNNAQKVTGTAPTFDTSAAGKACAQLYGITVAAVAREFGWDFARNTVTLTASGNTPPAPFSQEYLYPSNGVEVWQVMPTTLADPNDPLPINYEITNTLISSVQTKVIRCNITPAQAVYNNNPSEAMWDSIFVEAVTRALASKLAMALPGRPDTAKFMFETGAGVEKVGEGRVD